MVRNHSAIAKKTARTRATMKAARAGTKSEYDANRRLAAIQRAARELIAVRAGLGVGSEFRSLMESYPWGRKVGSASGRKSA